MRKIILSIATKDIEEFREVAKFAKENNFTHVVISHVEASMWQWNKDRTDPYPNWGMMQPALFKIIVPDKLKKYIPEEYTNRNLEVFKQRSEILREYGLKAVFIGAEPACFPEEAYREHPAWRGPRCDQPRRSRHEYYAPCVDNQEVLELYKESVYKLCQIIPIEYFQFMTNDSGSGICWSERLYPGANGPKSCKHISVADKAVGFLTAIQEAAAKAGVTAEVGYSKNFLEHEIAAIIPKLKDNQFCGKYTNSATVTTKGILGGAVRPNDVTNLLPGMPLTVRFMEMMMDTVDDNESNLNYSIASIHEKEYLEIIKRCTGKLRKSVVSKYENLRDVASVFVGEKYADNLVNIWEQIHYAQDRLAYLNRGGHIFTLGTVHQRWLTRPLVPFPSELTAEEKSYYRDYQFQAGTEEEADQMNNLQGTVWCYGESGRWLFEQNSLYAASAADQAITMVDELLTAEDIGEYRENLQELKLKLRMYKCIINNANNVLHFQSILDRTDYSETPVDTTLAIEEQGDSRMCKMERIIRDEIDNTYEIIELLDAVKAPLLACSPTMESKNIMKFGPDLKDDLLKKIEIMYNHKYELNRLYRSSNL